MSWFKIVFVSLLILGASSTITNIDQPRSPISSVTAAIITLINGVFIAGLILNW